VRARLAVVVAVAIAAAAASAQDAAGPTLALGGDVIFDAPILYAIDRFFDDRTEPALEELFAEIAPALTAADVAVVNLETPVAPRAFVRDADHDVPTFAAPPELMARLARSGVDAVTVANNHAYDQGVGGLASTLEHARAAGIVAIGAGADAAGASAAVVVERGGARIAFAAFSEGTNRRVREADAPAPRIAMADEERIAASVRAARASADLVVVSLHWTSSMDHDRPTRGMESLARAAAEAGADLVYAHGTHLPARSGALATADGRRVPVLWSLGNLVAAMEADDDRVHDPSPSVRDAVLARIATRRTGERLEIASIAIDPYWITSAERAWWPAPTSGQVRPLSIRAELARLDAARCGDRCDRWRESYERRAAMLSRRLSPEPETVETAQRAPRERTARAAHRDAASGETMPAAVDVPPDLARGAPLRVAFAPGSASERDVDEPQIRSLVALLVADRSLRVEIVARPAAGEPRSLAEARAHRARGLIAIHGPSRSRFALRTADASGAGSLTIRVTRR
jgi:poly-gamma-glutamate synthesis protein (capsule biosynthesis protein)